MIVSCAFREPYITHSNRQRDYISQSTPNLNLMYFIDKLPYGEGIVMDNIVSRFQKSLYGFKPHAIQKAIDMGHKKVIWLDPSVLPTVSMRVLSNALNHAPVIVRSGEEPLHKMCNTKSKKWFGVTDEDIKDCRTVAGTIYGFNFNYPEATNVFNLWKKAEEAGIFGTQDDFMAGHWADEACLSLAMFKCGVSKVWEDKFTYLNQKNFETTN